MITKTNSLTLATLTAAVALLPMSAQAGIFHRHPNATGLAAGLAAHHAAKHHGHGFAHRHPILTGIAAGAAAHHIAKHHG